MNTSHMEFAEIEQQLLAGDQTERAWSRWYDQAEQLLLASEWSLRDANPASFRYVETLRRLVRFYVARHRPIDAARFRRLLPPSPVAVAR